ncbi:hypothetical protein B4U79_09408, partial [Dinothrombium tinctorium]
MKPIDVSEENSKEVFRNMFGVDSKRDLLKTKNKNNFIKEGEDVRLKLNKIKKTIPKYKKPVYRISDSKDEEIIGTFYPEEIQKVTPPSILGAKEI